MPSTRNINSDLPPKVATITETLPRRGERNVPKRYLKSAEWLEDKDLGTGYYVADDDDEKVFHAIDFNFEALQWGLTTYNIADSNLSLRTTCPCTPYSPHI